MRKAREWFSYRATTTVTVTHHQGDAYGTTLATETHYFYGDPGAGPAFPNEPNILNNYTPWMVGRESQTDNIQADSSVLRTELQTWAQGDVPSPIWWSQVACSAQDSTYTECADTMPAELPRIVRTETMMPQDGNTINHICSWRALSYDRYNNVTDTVDYDYALDLGGVQVRQTHTTYLWPSGSQYVSTRGTVFLPGLPAVETVSLGGTTYSTTNYEYDNYQADSRHAALQARPSIVQMNPNYASGAIAKARMRVTPSIHRTPHGQ